MTAIAVYTHHSARYLCQIDVLPEVIARLDRPPPLEDNWINVGGTMVNSLKAEKHEVVLPTADGSLILFPVRVNGQLRIVTPTPDVALANAIRG